VGEFSFSNSGVPLPLTRGRRSPEWIHRAACADPASDPVIFYPHQGMCTRGPAKCVPAARCGTVLCVGPRAASSYHGVGACYRASDAH
jgi:hypothetical protein